MSETDFKVSRALENQSERYEPTPRGIKLKTIDDVRVEMAKVYREMRSNKIEAQQGTRLVYVLSAIAKAIEIHDIDQRITLLEEKNEH